MGGDAAECSLRRARALFRACDGKREKGGKDEARKSPVCAMLGGRVQRLWACRVTWQGREPVGCSLQLLLPRVPEKRRARVRWESLAVRETLLPSQALYWGSVRNVGRHSEFTNVYRAAQQGNGRWGGRRKATARREMHKKTPPARRPCALYPGLAFAATFIGDSLAYCEGPASASL